MMANSKSENVSEITKLFFLAAWPIILDAISEKFVFSLSIYLIVGGLFRLII